METRTAISGLDLVCETLGVALETLAKRAKVAAEDLEMARDERWHPATLVRLSEHLGVLPGFSRFLSAGGEPKMSNRNEVGAVETSYDGYRFRSRLEARWAIFFKTAGIRYIYEPECFRLPSGRLYLPDFYLPEVNMRTTEDKGGIYVEVKPSRPNSNEIDYLFELSQITGKSVLLIEGMPKSSDGHLDCDGDGHYEYSWELRDCGEKSRCISGRYCGVEHWDCHMQFMRCYKCLRVRVQYDSRWEPCEYCLEKTGEEVLCKDNHPSLVHAAQVARSYRFDKRGRRLRLPVEGERYGYSLQVLR